MRFSGTTGFGAPEVEAHPDRGVLFLYGLDPQKADAGFPADTPQIAAFAISFPGSNSEAVICYPLFMSTRPSLTMPLRPVRDSATICSLNSAGYGFLILGIWILSSQGQCVSIKPGELQSPIGAISRHSMSNL